MRDNPRGSHLIDFKRFFLLGVTVLVPIAAEAGLTAQLVRPDNPSMLQFTKSDLAVIEGVENGAQVFRVEIEGRLSPPGNDPENWSLIAGQKVLRPGADGTFKGKISLTGKVTPLDFLSIGPKGEVIRENADIVLNDFDRSGAAFGTRSTLLIGVEQSSSSEVISGQESNTRNRRTLPYFEATLFLAPSHPLEGQVAPFTEYGVTLGIGINSTVNTLSFPITKRADLTLMRVHRKFSWGGGFRYTNLLEGSPDLSGTTTPLPVVLRETSLFLGALRGEIPFRLLNTDGRMALVIGHTLTASTSAATGAASYASSLAGWMVETNIRMGIGHLFNRPIALGVLYRGTSLGNGSSESLRETSAGTFVQASLF